jgi:ATP-dependent exoDNAse (exonuclease V) alpha subunit
MDNNNNDKYFEILELSPDASLSEIKTSYRHLKKLYSTQSPVLSPLIDEIPEEKRHELIKQIEDAYMKLKRDYLSEKTEKQENTRYRVIQKSIPEFEVFSGNALKLMREVLGVELEDISLATGIPREHLKNIELEKFDLLPPKGYLRIYIMKYAEYLSLDPKHVVEDYMKAVDKKKDKRNPNRF